MTFLETPSDSRRARTQRRIFGAFSELVQSQRYDSIQVADIVRVADIGRSTFYEHFDHKNDVLAKSIAGMMQVIAESLCGQGNRENLDLILEHIWERRALARIIFSGETQIIVSQVLTDRIRELDTRDNKTVQAEHIALGSGTTEVLKNWVGGQLSINRDELVDWITGQVALKRHLTP